MTYNQKLVEKKKIMSLEDILNDERLAKLQKVLKDFRDIVQSYVESEKNGIRIYPEDLIIKIFKFEFIMMMIIIIIIIIIININIIYLFKIFMYMISLN